MRPYLEEEDEDESRYVEVQRPSITTNTVTLSSQFRTDEASQVCDSLHPIGDETFLPLQASQTSDIEEASHPFA